MLPVAGESTRKPRRAQRIPAVEIEQDQAIDAPAPRWRRLCAASVIGFLLLTFALYRPAKASLHDDEPPSAAGAAFFVAPPPRPPEPRGRQAARRRRRLSTG